MPATLGTVVHNLRRACLRRDEACATDGELLERFLTRRDEVAFEGLVRRHGPMVLGVCGRVLRNQADAEDAFQATFLLLVKKADCIRPRALVGNWLYGVAHTTALKARAMSSKRLAKERAAARPPQAIADTSADARALLDHALRGLPDKYRAVIVLCELEGQSQKEAARQLGCPLGTIGTRLRRGRHSLARRLARCGLAVPGGAVGALIAQNAQAAGVSLPLLHSTVKAAALLAAGRTAGSLVSVKVANLTRGVLTRLRLRPTRRGQ